MSFSNYLVKTNSEPEIRRLIGENYNQLFRMVINSEVVIGIPTLEPRTLGNLKKDRVLIIRRAEKYRVRLSQISSAEPINPLVDDQRFMSAAVEISRSCVSEKGVKPKVGAILVSDGIEIGRAHRGQLIAGDHAEHTLLDDIMKSASNVRGATLYTTLEPCTDRNGAEEYPCVHRIIDRRIGRVVIGMLDPNSTIQGEGIWRLRDAGIDVSVAEMEMMAEIEDINRDFIKEHRPKWRNKNLVDSH